MLKDVEACLTRWPDDPVLNVMDSSLRWQTTSLGDRVVLSAGGRMEATLVRYGKPYLAAEKPPGVKRGKMKGCFKNAGDRALKDVGTYVEGFALCSGDTSRVIHHAWLTTGGNDAVEVTWKGDEMRHAYFGLAVPNSVLMDCMAETRHYGVFETAPRYDVPEALKRYLARRDAGLA